MFRVLTLYLFFGLFALNLQAATSKSAELRLSKDLVRANLIAEPAAVRAGETFWIALHMSMRPGWHIYWRNPGDAGLPPTLTWSLSTGFTVGPMKWPAPERIPVATLMNFGYANEAVFLVPVTPPSNLDPRELVRIKAKLSYLVCKTECVPGAEDLALSLPVALEAAPDPNAQDLFAKARAALPVPSHYPSRLTRQGDQLVLNLDAAGLRPEAFLRAAFFPYAENVLDNAAEQALAVDAAGLHLTLSLANPAELARTILPGVVVIEQDFGTGPKRISLAVGEETASLPPNQFPATEGYPPPISNSGSAPSVSAGVLIAFLGGLVLNLTPCVFPILLIVVLGLVQHKGETHARVRQHGLAYTAGVLAFLLSLAGVLIALKSAGAEPGWDLQLRSPVFVSILAYLLFAIGLTLSGATHLGARVAGFDDCTNRRTSLRSSFFAGVVATLCSAPFIGAVMGLARPQSALAAFAVLVGLGLGLGLPILLLCLWPGVLRRLPRPGSWMEVLKQVLAFAVYATVAWLVWVLAQQVDAQQLLNGLVGLVLVGFAAWVWEQGRYRSPLPARTSQGLAVLAVLAAGILSIMEHGHEGLGAGSQQDISEPFTLTRFEALRTAERPILINMTAAWCITCQVNERLALPTAAVQATLRARGVTYLKGDWTNQNPEITRLLEAHGRSGVPLYLLYPSSGAPFVLPQILTKDVLVAAIEKLGAGRSVAQDATVPH